MEPEKKKRRSRFDDAGDNAPISALSMPNLVVAAAVAKPPLNLNTVASSMLESTQRAAAEQIAKAAEMQAQLASQIASVTNMLSKVQDSKLSGQEKKAAYRPLLLDASGREVDETGNLVRQNFSQVKTLAANVAVTQAQKKKENPYLAHKAPPPLPMAVLQQAPGQAVSQVPHPQQAVEASTPAAAVDERLAALMVPGADRERRGRKALSFVEAGVCCRCGV